MKTLMDTTATADYLGVSEQTLANWRWRSVGPRWCKIGGRVKYELAQIDAYIESRTVETEPAA